jgi:hypothetical protein
MMHILTYDADADGGDDDGDGCDADDDDDDDNDEDDDDDDDYVDDAERLHLVKKQPTAIHVSSCRQLR